MPDGCFNNMGSYSVVDDYEKLQHVIHKNKQLKAHWEANLRKYAHRTKPLFGVFTSEKVLRWALFRLRCRGTGSCIWKAPKVAMANLHP